MILKGLEARLLVKLPGMALPETERGPGVLCSRV